MGPKEKAHCYKEVGAYGTQHKVPRTILYCYVRWSYVFSEGPVIVHYGVDGEGRGLHTF
jgi:hypothetical protein